VVWLSMDGNTVRSFGVSEYGVARCLGSMEVLFQISFVGWGVSVVGAGKASGAAGNLTSRPFPPVRHPYLQARYDTESAVTRKGVAKPS